MVLTPRYFMKASSSGDRSPSRSPILSMISYGMEDGVAVGSDRPLSREIEL